WRSQMWLGRQLGHLAAKVLKSRVKIARRNLELAMPELTLAEREKLLKQNFESVGCATAAESAARAGRGQTSWPSNGDETGWARG
ncbi:hypothetical protein ACNF5D_28050, partial [Escherichia coli]